MGELGQLVDVLNLPRGDTRVVTSAYPHVRTQTGVL